MKNVLKIAVSGQKMLYSTDDGTNTLFINDTQIASSNWVGSGTYTTTVNGHTISIAKVASISGNLKLVETGTYTYEFRQPTAEELVTGVKGDAEGSYRAGNVNLTPANIGANDAVKWRYSQSSSTSVATSSATFTTLRSANLTAGHMYIISYVVQVSANANGSRYARVTSGGTSVDIMGQATVKATGDRTDHIHATFFRNPTANETIDLQISQNSGSALSCAARWQIIDLGTNFSQWT